MPSLFLLITSVLVGVQLQLIRAQLEPLFNSLPLALHAKDVYLTLAAVAVASRVLFWAVGTPSPSRMLFVAAYACAAPALANLGRWAGVLAGAQLGPERGAIAAQVLLAAPLAAAIFPIAIPPIRAANELSPTSSIAAQAVVISAHAIPLCAAGWASEFISQSAGARAFAAASPELHMLKLSIVFAALSVRFLQDEAVERTRADLVAAKKGDDKAAARTQQPPAGGISPFALALRALPVLTAGAAYMAHQTAPFFTDEMRVHSSVPSVGGRIVVIDNIAGGYRALRADHSLIGGMWIDQKEGDVTGMAARLGDSVFAAMPLQEIALLAREPEKDDRLLVIGLGAGVGAEFYTRRGLSVDVVEYDQAVYEASRDYFGLVAAPPASVSITDGAAYVAAAAPKVRSGQEKPWKYIIHDVFSAGSMPVDLFTHEFWSDAESILAPDGVVSMNFAGPIHATMTQRIIATLVDVFGHCRCFDDSFTASSKESDEKNLVCICAREPVEFRVATTKDLLGSPLRRRVYGAGGEWGDGAYLQNEISVADMIGGDGKPTPDLILHRGEAVNATEWDLRLANDVWASVSSLMPPHFWVAW